ncbi:MAG: hypothetical protein RLZZ618_465 [Pseudomonadota bacterium]
MQRFELTDTSSSKFWEVNVVGADLVVRFGRIGTDGQTKTKTLADGAAAEKERSKLVKEKQAKGYVPAGVTAGLPAVAAAKPISVPAPPASTPAASQRNAATTPPVLQASALPLNAPAPAPAASTDLLPLTWPNEGFQWTPLWDELLPVMRGIKAPPIPSALDMLSSIPRLADVPASSTGLFDKVVASSHRHWTPWQAADSEQHLTRDKLSRADPDFWLELLGQVNVLPHRGSQALWFAKVGLSLHGLPFMLNAVLALRELVRDNPLNINPTLKLLRQAIASASDEAALEAQAIAAAVRTRHPDLMVVCTALFPHLTDWAVECAGLHVDDPEWQIEQSALPMQVLLQQLKRRGNARFFFKNAVALQVKLHGNEAIAVLALDFQRVTERLFLDHALGLIRLMQVPELIPILMTRAEDREVRSALENEYRRHPVAVLKTAIEHTLSSKSTIVERWTLKLAFSDALVLESALLHLSERDRQRFGELMASLRQTDAEPGDLPAFLRSPPWLKKERAQALPTIDSPMPAPTLRIEFPPSQQASCAQWRARPYFQQRVATPEAARDYALNRLAIRPEAHGRLLAGEWLRPEDVVPPPSFNGAEADVLAVAEPALALALWNSYPIRHWSNWDLSYIAMHLLVVHGAAALPGLGAFLQAFPESGLSLMAEVDSPVIVPTALHALRKLKKAKPHAVAWIRAHLATTLPVALSLAFGKDKPARDDGQHALRWLIAQGHDVALSEAAALQGPAMSEALEALRRADPLLIMPSRVPKLPSFFVASALRRPVLNAGDALPVTAVEHIGTMLAMSSADAPYAGLALLREVCTRASLATFAWDLYEAWLIDGAPAKDSWAFQALGFLGDDNTAHRLAPLMRAWPSEGLHQRAITALGLLEAIGSDVALMHLNGIAHKVKSKPLQDKAQEKIEAIADARGLDAAQLADRLVPDLGLDEHGSLNLDFGPRQFTVGFDHDLKPVVKDAQGTRQKDLPKPIKSDDEALAEAAALRFKQLKKDAKALAKLQLDRLESAMVTQRRWTEAEFRMFFLEHPLMRHLAARLVWGVYAEGDLVHAFRVAEDWTLADQNDSHFALADSATLGLVHMLEMADPLQAAFGQVFADYEILQPFKQLGRETYALTEAERSAKEITRFKDKAVAVGSVLGLAQRSWERNRNEDGGWITQLTKPADGGLQLNADLDPGTPLGDTTSHPRQKFARITLRQPGTWDDEGLRPFSQLSPIAASEMLRDIDLLAPLKDTP